MGLIKRAIRRKIRTPAKRAIRQKIRQPAKRALRRKVTRPAKAKLRRLTSVKCGRCGKRYTNKLTHTCVIKTDYRKRLAAQKRREEAAARRQRRLEAAARRKAAAAARRQSAVSLGGPIGSRPRPPAHNYRTCRDADCTRYGCTAYRQGIADCPLYHQ